MSKHSSTATQLKLHKFPLLLSTLEKHGKVVITCIPDRPAVLKVIKTFYEDFTDDNVRIPPDPAIRVHYFPKSFSFSLAFSDSLPGIPTIPYNVAFSSKPIL